MVSTLGPWMRIPEAAEYLRCSVPTIKRLIGARDVPSYSVAGNITLLSRTDLDAYVQEKRREKVG